MATKRKGPTRVTARKPSVDSVDAFMRGLDHPLKPALALVCAAIRSASPSISEGIKWNAPSFALTESGRFFATVNIHGTKKDKECVLLVLHRDAKPSSPAAKKPDVDDPSKLLDWLAKDRCVVRFADRKDAKAKAAALQGIVRQWIAQL